MAKTPFKYDLGAVEQYVVVECPDRDYGILRVFVPEDFWSEGKYLLTKIWNQPNPGIHTDGSFQEVDGLTLFNFSPMTVGSSKLVSAYKTIVTPVYAASRSIKCLVEWPELVTWKNAHNTGGPTVSPLDEDSPARFLLDATQGGIIKAIPFGDGRMVPDSSAELDYLAHSS